MAHRIALLVSEAGGRAYFVGGFVRDQLMGRECKDIDIELHNIEPDRVRDILNSLGRCITMGASFGVFGLEHYEIDIAMPRRERANGHGHKDFEIFVDPYIGTKNASERRDFTINALMQDILTGEIIDHYNGLNDLRAGIIRHVKAATFIEDPLRVLRAAQFAARFDFLIDPATVDLCRTMDLSFLPPERVFAETVKALDKAPCPSLFFKMLRNMNALDRWFPELKALIGVEQDPVHHPEGDVWTHTMSVIDEAARLRMRAENHIGLMFAAVCHDMGKPVTTSVSNGRVHAYEHETIGLPIVERAMKQLTNETRLIKYVLNMVELHMKPNRNAQLSAKQKSFMHMFDQSICPNDLLLLARADALGCVADPISRPDAERAYEATEARLREMLTVYEELMRQPQVMGRDLAEAGIRPGPLYAQALAYAHKLHLAGVPKPQALKQTLGEIRKMS